MCLFIHSLSFSMEKICPVCRWLCHSLQLWWPSLPGSYCTPLLPSHPCLAALEDVTTWDVNGYTGTDYHVLMLIVLLPLQPMLVLSLGIPFPAATNLELCLRFLIAGALTVLFLLPCTMKECGEPAMRTRRKKSALLAGIQNVLLQVWMLSVKKLEMQVTFYFWLVAID